MKSKRQLLLYLLVFIFLLGTLVSIAGVVGLLQSWNWLTAFSPSTIPIYGVFKGVFLTLVCLVAVVILWLKFSWSVTYCTIVSIVTAAWFWVDRVILTKNPLPFNRHVLPLIITFLLLALIMLSFYFIEPYLNMSHLQSSETGNQFIQRISEEDDQTSS